MRNMSLGAQTVILTLAVMVLGGCARRVVISVDDVEKMIREQVPIGAEKQKVKNFIDGIKVDALEVTRGEFRKVDKRFPPVGFWDRDKLAHLWDNVAELIGARIKDTEGGFQNHNDIFIEFAIDKNGLMIGYTVRMVGTE